MAIELGTETETFALQERTFRVVIDVPRGGDPVVEVHRETVKTDGNGNVISIVPGVVFRRFFSRVAAQSVTVNGKTYTLPESADLIAAWADKWRQEDMA